MFVTITDLDECTRTTNITRVSLKEYKGDYVAYYSEMNLSSPRGLSCSRISKDEYNRVKTLMEQYAICITAGNEGFAVTSYPNQPVRVLQE